MSVLITSLVAVAGLWYSNVQTRQATEQTRQATDQARQDRALAKEGQVTDRYTAAVTNLGDDKMDVRLGGIYALQRIMQDSTRDQPTIANVLATYVRTHAAKPPAKGQDIPADVQGAVTVLATRDTTHDQNFVLNLRNAWLPKAQIAGCITDQHRVHLSSSVLSHPDMYRAHLSGANLGCADLSGATLAEADLSGAELLNADLRGTFLDGADLRGATIGGDLRGASLNGADLRGAFLGDADLRGVDLSVVKNLSKKQLASATTDGATTLPAGF